MGDLAAMHRSNTYLAQQEIAELHGQLTVMREALKRTGPQRPYPVMRYHKYAGKQVPIRVTCPTCKKTVNLKEQGHRRDPEPVINDLSWHEPECSYVYVAQILATNTGKPQAKVVAAAVRQASLKTRIPALDAEYGQEVRFIGEGYQEACSETDEAVERMLGRAE